ncbi:hypothetical protein N9L66_00585 [Porticoccaceae bacterium]|nr:hypothetical protein [Porticoccaceae bacterium]MDB2343102.1 hypothetical protein [Porticoccaceae bacterium]
MNKRAAQIKKLQRSGKALLDFQMTGRLPTVIEARSPLIDYLSSLSNMELSSLKHVRIGPSVGYNTVQSFSDGHQLLRFLRPDKFMPRTWPAESYRLKSFCTEVTRQMLVDCQAEDHPLRQVQK